jgi:hypothetical protein
MIVDAHQTLARQLGQVSDKRRLARRSWALQQNGKSRRTNDEGTAHIAQSLTHRLCHNEPVVGRAGSCVAALQHLTSSPWRHVAGAFHKESCHCDARTRTRSPHHVAEVVHNPAPALGALAL